MAVKPSMPCKSGNYNHWPDMIFCATLPYNCNPTRYYALAIDFCYKLPDNVTMKEGALLEQLLVGVYACRCANVQLGMEVLI